MHALSGWLRSIEMDFDKRRCDSCRWNPHPGRRTLCVHAGPCYDRNAQILVMKINMIKEMTVQHVKPCYCISRLLPTKLAPNIKFTRITEVRALRVQFSSL